MPTEFKLDKKASSQGVIYFEGYASIFNTPDSYNDIILPGAFEDTLKEKGPRQEKDADEIDSDIVALWQHNPDWPFGLPHQMEEDSTGLWHRTMISNTNENMDRVQYMEDKVVKGESIGFVTLDAEWAEEDDDAFDEESFWLGRYLKKIDLWEISPVTFAAHNDAVTTLIQRNRELMLAVKNVDHGAILATAYGMKGITVPQIEEAIAVMEAVRSSLESSEEEQIEETEGDESVDTSGEDPDLVKELEAIAERMDLALIEQKIRTGGRH